LLCSADHQPFSKGKDKKMIDAYKNAWGKLQPHMVVAWVGFYVACILSFLLLIPFAGYLMMQLGLIRENKKMDFGDLFSQFDNLVQLLILFVVFIVLNSVLYIPVYIVIWILAKMSPGLASMAGMGLMFVLYMLVTPFLTYALLLVCDKKSSAVDAVKKSLEQIMADIAGNFMLGLGVILSMIPCYLGGPIGYFAIVDNYNKKFT
jgi:hypothetical protein